MPQDLPTLSRPAHALHDPAARRLALALESAVGAPFSHGAQIDVLRNGVEIFPAMLEAIAGARRRIEFLTFVYWTGEIADRFAQALADRAREGVEVLVVLDGFGARPMDREHLKMMEDAGVQVRWFRPLANWRLWRSAHRTHRKVLIIDGRVGFAGGVGIASEWEGDAEGPEHWRDTHFRIRGPAVAGLRAAFYEDWMEAGGDLGPLFSVAPTPSRARPGVDAAGGALVQVVPAGASVGLNSIARLHNALIRLSRRRLRICTPYFSPDQVMAELLIAAADRGVEVEVMMPGPVIDKRLSELAGSEFWSDLMRAGVQLVRYQPTMLHAKLITVDGRLASIGSANFNQRSRLKDHELALNLLDPELTARLDAHFEEDRERCRPVDLRRWRKRSWLRRAAEKAAAPLRTET
ncbi:MAG: phospholipase D-like domain-containing protein [Albimonas sp.]|uniref:phospholipase D-like domain-containing protein n=1 Tax=Albimonas sp. TaxID=1872425 RepID=UPI0040571956